MTSVLVTENKGKEHNSSVTFHFHFINLTSFVRKLVNKDLFFHDRKGGL